MTNEEIRIAVALELGWTKTYHGWWIDPKNPGAVNHDCPNYPEDLNAIAEAVVTLSDDEREKYWKHLITITQAISTIGLIEATARQRCESFLRAKLLWKEEK